MLTLASATLIAGHTVLRDAETPQVFSVLPGPPSVARLADGRPDTLLIRASFSADEVEAGRVGAGRWLLSTRLGLEPTVRAEIMDALGAMLRAEHAAGRPLTTTEPILRSPIWADGEVEVTLWAGSRALRVKAPIALDDSGREVLHTDVELVDLDAEATDILWAGMLEGRPPATITWRLTYAALLAQAEVWVRVPGAVRARLSTTIWSQAALHLTGGLLDQPASPETLRALGPTVTARTTAGAVRQALQAARGRDGMMIAITPPIDEPQALLDLAAERILAPCLPALVGLPDDAPIALRPHHADADQIEIRWTAQAPVMRTLETSAPATFTLDPAHRDAILIESRAGEVYPLLNLRAALAGIRFDGGLHAVEAEVRYAQTDMPTTRRVQWRDGPFRMGADGEGFVSHKSLARRADGRPDLRHSVHLRAWLLTATGLAQQVLVLERTNARLALTPELLGAWQVHLRWAAGRAVRRVQVRLIRAAAPDVSEVLTVSAEQPAATLFRFVAQAPLPARVRYSATLTYTLMDERTWSPPPIVGDARQIVVPDPFELLSWSLRLEGALSGLIEAKTTISAGAVEAEQTLSATHRLSSVSLSMLPDDPRLAQIVTTLRFADGAIEALAPLVAAPGDVAIRVPPRTPLDVEIERALVDSRVWARAEIDLTLREPLRPARHHQVVITAPGPSPIWRTWIAPGADWRLDARVRLYTIADESPVELELLNGTEPFILIDPDVE